MSTTPPDLNNLRIRRDEPGPGAGSGARRGAPRLLLIVIAIAIVGGALALVLRPGPVRVDIALAEASGGGVPSAEGITANGYVVARTKASIAAKIPGRMEYLGVHEGSLVRKGEVIARLESADQQAALRSARANVGQIEAQLGQARRDLERATSLAAQQVLSAAELENARTKADVLEAQLNASHALVQQAQVNVENTRVRAPFDGTVLRKDAEVGEIVAPSSAGGGLTRTAIVTMADLATLEVEVDVNEAYIAQIRGAQPARITLDAYPDTSFAGRVRQVVPTADRQKATVQVKVSILDRDPRILPEMGAKVIFVRGGDGALALSTTRRVMVPAAALVRGASAMSVWIVENGRVVSRPVDAGLEHDGKVEVRSGLSGGESVVLRPPAGLRDGVRVRVPNS
jgi:RND family efflux transporter MFP subunit